MVRIHARPIVNSTAKIKHCYGVIAGALSVARILFTEICFVIIAKPLQSEFLPNGGCNKSHEHPQKTLSVVINYTVIAIVGG